MVRFSSQSGDDLETSAEIEKLVRRMGERLVGLVEQARIESAVLGEFITIQQAGELIKWSKSSVERGIRTGSIPSKKLGRSRRVDRDGLLEAVRTGTIITKWTSPT